MADRTHTRADAPPRPPMGTAERLRRFGPLVLIAMVIAVAFLSGWHREVTFTRLVENRAWLRAEVDAHGILTALAYVAVYAGVVALSIPGALALTVTGGFLFGWLLGGSLAVLAATAGATVIFLVTREAAGADLERSCGARLQKLAEGFRADAFNYLLFLRLVPACPFWFVNLASGLLGVKLRVFLAATLIGVVPATFAFALVGAGLDGVVSEQEAALAACRAAGNAACEAKFSVHKLLSWPIMAAIASLGLVAILPVAVKKMRAMRAR